FLTQAIAPRHAHVLEGDAAGRLTVPAHFFFLTAIADAWRIGRHRKGADALGAILAGARHHDQKIARSTTGNEGLAAADEIVIAIALRTGFQRGGIRTRTRLGKAVGADLLATG